MLLNINHSTEKWFSTEYQLTIRVKYCRKSTLICQVIYHVGVSSYGFRLKQHIGIQYDIYSCLFLRFIGWQLEVRRDSTSNGTDVKSLNILAIISKRNYMLSIEGGEITYVHPIHVMGNTHNQESGTCKCMHKSSQLYEKIRGWLCSIHAHKHTRIHIHTHRRKRIHTFLACGTLEQSSINSVTNSIPLD